MQQRGEEKLEFCVIFIHLHLQKWQEGVGGGEGSAGTGAWAAN